MLLASSGIRRWLTASLLGMAVAATLVSCQSLWKAADAPTELTLFADETVRAQLAFNPVLATALGEHSHDREMNDYSRTAIDKRVTDLKSFASRLESLQKTPLRQRDSLDARVLAERIQGELLDLETLKTWRLNPMIYVETAGAAVDVLVKRSFAPPKDRLRAAIERMKKFPDLFRSMRANVKNPPREFTEMAVRVGNGSIEFLNGTVSSWARESAQGDPVLLAEFEAAKALAVMEMKAAAKWLQNDLLPKSRGKFALGRENLAKKLRHEEMVDAPLEKLLALAEANLEKDRAEFIRIAKLIDPKKPPAQVLRAITGDHPNEMGLLPTAREAVEEALRFVDKKRIITVPNGPRPVVTLTPAYARAGTFAMMDAPGPLERVSLEAYFYVTPVEPQWSATRKSEHLRMFSRAGIFGVAIHETYPGHHVQFLAFKALSGKVRQVHAAMTNVEGWAHYAEQMMLDEGFGGGDLRLRLGQLQAALLRDCRFIAGLRLHAQKWTVADAKRAFAERCFQEPSTALEEARRGTYDPLYLAYTLGKLQIFQLREDYRKAKGASFSLREFHDLFIQQGPLPVRLIREVLLPEGSAAPANATRKGA